MLKVNEGLRMPPIAERIWDMKYRLRAPDGTPVDRNVGDTLQRVARAVARAEAGGMRKASEAAFLDAMADFELLPAGRILAGAGASRRVTLFNCFVMGTIEDDLSSIFEHVREAALTMQQGGGIGHDFSTLRPRGAPVKSVGADASGAVSFMDVWDAMCRTIVSAGQRRGAMMATLRCDHPDIEEFIAVKADAARLRNFNLSVLATDAFIAAVRADRDWDLVFAGRVFKTVRARELWGRIMRATYDYAEPGVIFIDRINAENNLEYCETIQCTNPCGEEPLPPYGACLLGSLNLARLVARPFEPDARLDESRLAQLTRTAVRFLDNVIDVSGYPLKQQQAEARAKRRVGLGVTGLADAQLMLGLRYGGKAACETAGRWMSLIARTAYLASAELAAEKGAFPLCDREKLLARPMLERMPREVRAAVMKHGLRNGLLTSIAPTGTISLLAGNVSSGIEPIFDYQYTRRVLGADAVPREEVVEDYAWHLWRQRHAGGAGAALGDAFVRAGELSPSEHLAMQAALQPHVDSSISKTINVPADLPFEAFEQVYLEAYELGLKGCTTYRPNEVTGAVLSAGAGSGSGSAVARTEAGAVPALAQPGESAGLARPIAREPVLSGCTYKLRWADSDHAMYVTINDIEHEGRRRPFEIFINSKNLEHYAWTVALTRMISAVFRRGGDVTFVVEELKAVFDPRGGHWMEGRYVPSLLAAIGNIIEQHMLRTGFLEPEQVAGLGHDAPATIAVATSPAHNPRVDAAVAQPRLAGPPGAQSGPVAGGRPCPRCSLRALVHQEGCWVCLSCGFSRCS